MIIHRPGALCCPKGTCGTAWAHELVGGGIGPLLSNYKCPRCREWWKIGYRVGVGAGARFRVELVGIVRSSGADLTSLRRDLLQFAGFSDDDRAVIMTMAPLFGLANGSPSVAADADPVDAFLAEHCSTGASSSVPAGELYLAYRTWCRERDIAPGTSRGFGKALRTRGLEAIKSKVWRWRGVRLLTPTRTSPKSSPFVPNVPRRAVAR